jgi:CubicO group peptidase (beta-lactamase class C family)
MAVLMLVEQGAVGLDDSVSKYLPRLPPSYDAVTVRHLLTHTSGIIRNFARRSCPPFSWEHFSGDLLYQALASAELKFEPGTAQSYSNTGYDLIAMLIEAVSGKSYQTFLKVHIFDPLGMDATQSIEPEDVIPPRLSIGHQWQEKNKRYQTKPPIFAISAGIITTLIDMAKWDAALYTEDLVSQATLKQIWTPYTLTGHEPDTSGYGFGWAIKEEAGTIIVGHKGYFEGRSATFVRFISKKLSLIVFTNGGSVDQTEEIALETAGYYNLHIQAASSK